MKTGSYENEKVYSGRRSTQSYLEAYSVSSGAGDNKGCMEQPETFRSGFSCFDMRNEVVTPGAYSKWTAPNCGGLPMDYDRNKQCVYMDGSDGHSLLIGATGSKKSRLVVMPTVRLLAASGEAMIVCDPKGEIYQRTGNYLEKQGYQIHVINLRNPQRGDGWNILEVPYLMYVSGHVDKACEYINDITANLIPIVAKDPFWDYSTRDMTFGLILLLFRICKEKRLPSDLVNMRSLIKLRGELFYTSDSSAIQRSDLWKFAKEDELIRTRLQGTVVCPEKTMSCIISEFDQHFSIFSLQPQLVSLLSNSTFDLREIGFGKIAIFLVITDEKTVYNPLVTLLLKQMYEILIDNAYRNTKDYRFPTRVNFILDEFTSLPKMADMPQMITASRSRNIRYMLVVQSKHQLQQRYGEEADSIMSNCSNWMFLTSRETALLREISELSGTTGSGRDPLISIFRLQHLDKDTGECLIFSGRKKPYFSHLPDIEEYDNNLFPERHLPLRKPPELHEKDYRQESFFQQLVSVKNIDHELGKRPDSNILQAKLEAKFDELFGKIDTDCVTPKPNIPEAK